MAEQGGVPQKPKQGDELSPMAKQMQAAQPWVGAVWKLLGGCVVGVLAGMWMDKHFGTTPWGLVGLSVLGICVGFYAFIRTALRLGKAEKR